MTTHLAWLALAVLLGAEGCGGRVLEDPAPGAPGDGPSSDAASDRSPPPPGCISREGAGVRLGTGFELLREHRQPSALALREGGGLLIGSPLPEPNVSVVSETGQIASGGSVQLPDAEPSGLFELSPKGDGFLAGPFVYDDLGSLTGVIAEPLVDAGAGALLSNTFSASGRTVVASWGTVGLEHDMPLAITVVDRAGRTLASFAADISRAAVPRTDDSVLGVSSAGVGRWSLDGRVEWSVPAPNPQNLAISADGQNAVTIDSLGTLTHIERGAIVSSTDVPTSTYHVAMAPGGRWSAAGLSQPPSVRTFEAGVPARTVDLDFTHVDALAIDDRGEVLVSAGDWSSTASIVMLEADGSLAFRCTRSGGDAPYVDAAILAQDGAALGVLWLDRVQYARLER